MKNSGEILDKLKARDFNAISLSTYDTSKYLYDILSINNVYFYSLHYFTS